MSKSAAQKERKGGCGSSYSPRGRYGGQIGAYVDAPGTYIGSRGAFARGDYPGAPVASVGPGGLYIGPPRAYIPVGGGERKRWSRRHHEKYGGDVGAELGPGWGGVGGHYTGFGVGNLGLGVAYGGGRVAYGGQGYYPAGYPMGVPVMDPCARPNYFAQQFQERIVNGGGGKTRFLPDDVIDTLDLPAIELYSQMRCGRGRNPNMCAGADMMVTMIEEMDNSYKNGSLFAGWPGENIRALAAIAILGLCREKLYRGLRGEITRVINGRLVQVDAGELCVPFPREGVANDPLYQQALAMTEERCGPEGMKPRLTYRVAKMLAIAKGRGREMTADEVAALKMPPPQITPMVMPMADKRMMLAAALAGGGCRLPARLGGTGRRVVKPRKGGSAAKARKGGSRQPPKAKAQRSAGKGRKSKYAK